MSYHDFIEGLRLMNAFVAAGIFGILCYRGRRFWPKYTRIEKWMYLSLTGYAMCTSYTSFELFEQDVTIGPKSYFVLVANVIALYTIWISRQEGSAIMKDRRLLKRTRDGA